MVETHPASSYVEGDPRLHVLEWAHPGEAFALLIHGSFGNSAVWSDFAPRLASRVRVIAPDLRGHGASGWPSDGDYSLPALVDDMERLLSALALQGSVVVMGHSLGNIIAVKLAARIGSRVKGLVLVDHALRLEEDHREHLVSVGQRRPRVFETLAEGTAWATRLTGRNADPNLARAVAVANVVAEGDRFRQAFDQRFLASLTAWDCESEMKLVSAPVLIVRAGDEPVLREAAAERMVSGFPHAELVTVAGAGHNVFLERPAEFAEVVRNYLDRTLPTGFVAG